MAVKDDPNTRIKAADAKAFFLLASPEDYPAAIDALIEKHGLKALVVVLASADKPVLLAVAPGDKQGSRLLHNWAVQTVQNLPGIEKSCILLGLRDDGWADIATHGKTRALCDKAGRWGKDLFQHLYVAPFQTWFGFGTDGVPTQMTEDQLSHLSESGRAYVARHTHPEAKEA